MLKESTLEHGQEVFMIKPKGEKMGYIKTTSFELRTFFYNKDLEGFTSTIDNTTVFRDKKFIVDNFHDSLEMAKMHVYKDLTRKCFDTIHKNNNKIRVCEEFLENLDEKFGYLKDKIPEFFI